MADKGQKRYEKVVARLRGAIESGQLVPGDRLPPERALAEELAVSRNSVREALRVLTQQGLVQSRRGDGTYVCVPDETVFSEALAKAMGAGKKRMQDIFEFRKTLEPRIAELAAEKITPQALDRLKLLVFEQERRVLQQEDTAALDTQFHTALAEASGNRIFVQVIQTLNPVLEESRVCFLQSDQRRKSSIAAHIVLIDAIEKKDAPAAREAMENHLRDIERTVLGNGPQEEGTFG